MSLGRANFLRRGQAAALFLCVDCSGNLNEGIVDHSVFSRLVCIFGFFCHGEIPVNHPLGVEYVIEERSSS